MFIRTVRGRGIQFVVPVAATETTEPEDGRPSPDIAIQPAIYVRPFDTMGDACLDQLARALRVRTGSVLTPFLFYPVDRPS